MGYTTCIFEGTLPDGDSVTLTGYCLQVRDIKSSRKVTLLSVPGAPDYAKANMAYGELSFGVSMLFENDREDPVSYREFKDGIVTDLNLMTGAIGSFSVTYNSGGESSIFDGRTFCCTSATHTTQHNQIFATLYFKEVSN